jgi:hypothetical protein
MRRSSSVLKRRNRHSCELLLTLSLGALSACAPSSSTLPHTQATDRVPVSDGLWVDRGRGEVVVNARIATREGWLEQLVCKAGTREHESLLAVAVQPSLIHAALLVAGAQPGAPGSWREEQGEGGVWRIAYDSPRGTPVEVFARIRGETGERDEPLCAWVRGVREQDGKLAEQRFPCDRFVFAGSHVRPNPPSLGAGEHYVADYTGSIVGLVTFGDEMIAFTEVIPDKIDLAPAVWTAHTARIPPEGSAVQLVIRAAKAQAK